jgi:hypothetical protein
MKATPSVQATTAIRSPFVVMGGVGGGMYLAAAIGVWPYRWVIAPRDARRWAYREHAESIATLVGGRVEVWT